LVIPKTIAVFSCPRPPNWVRSTTIAARVFARQPVEVVV
jgi:hypothetical protein